MCFKSPTASYIFNTSYCGCICQSYGSRLEPNTAHTHCVFVRPDELRWWGFNFQDILWLRPMLVAYQYSPQLRASQFLSVQTPWNNDTLPYTIAPQPSPCASLFWSCGIQVATFAALAEFNCIMKFSPQTAVVSSVDQVQDAVNGAVGCTDGDRKGGDLWRRCNNSFVLHCI